MSSTVVIFRCCNNCKTIEDNCIDSSCTAGLKSCFSLKSQFALLGNINSPLTLLVYKIIVRGAIEPVDMIESSIYGRFLKSLILYGFGSNFDSDFRFISFYLLKVFLFFKSLATLLRHL